MTLQEPAFGEADGDTGMDDGTDRPGRADEASDDDTTSSSPAEIRDPQFPKEDEVLSSAARAAVLENDVLGQTQPGQGLDDEQGSSKTPLITMARAYQLEMCEESMKRNIIAVMDTGSGKTHVSILRMEKELERMSSEKMIWFLAPTVALCEQQFKVICRQIPSVQVKLLSGEDNVDSWSSVAIWTEFLLNVKIVVSTYQILYDALSHAFVRLDTLALVVFDEAHNCVKNNPGRKIMTMIYRRYRDNGRQVPHILGLTASPSMSSTEKDLVALEKTLDAVCRTPTTHREELLARVKRPTVRFERWTQYETAGTVKYPRAFITLEAIYRGLDIREDPYVQYLCSLMTDRSTEELREVIMKKKTFVQTQMLQLLKTSSMLIMEIGPWAVDYFISGTIDRFTSAVKCDSPLVGNLKTKEKEYLADRLSKVDHHHSTADELSTSVFSDKVNVLLQQLASQEEGTVGIVFADERIKVSILAHLISMHPLTKDRYKVGSAVGGSSYASRKRDLSELWGQGRDLDVDLEEFRSGKLNLLVATSVLEEGIDVPVCNLVICFDYPKNLTSFVQRRGRARQKDSNLIILNKTGTEQLKDWANLEAQLRKQYEDDERVQAELAHLESEEHDAEEFVLRGQGGAFVDMDGAKNHLAHFCNVLSPRELVDSRPEYIIRESCKDDALWLSAEVILPIFIPAHVRTSKSAKTWMSEKNATKDAAFQAYLALYKAGLLNEHLLPFRGEKCREKIESRASIIKVSNLVSPWAAVADAWTRQDLLSCHVVTLRDERGRAIGEYDMAVPALVPPPTRITVYPDETGPWSIEIGPAVRRRPEADHTTALLSMTLGHRQAVFNEQRQHLVTFAARGADLALSQIGGRDLVDGISEQERRLFLIRDPSSHPFLYDGVLPQKPRKEDVRRPSREFELAPSKVSYLSLTKWSRRTDFLHKVPDTAMEASVKPYGYVLEASRATIDEIPMHHAHFGKLIPCIIHELEVQLLAAMVADTLSHGVRFSNLELIRAAISPRSSAEPLNYERMELLGDSVLKVCAAVNVAALFPSHPEGYLSFYCDKMVSNAYLSRACMERGLDKFILDRPFTGRKWRPLFVDEVAERAEKAQSGKRMMSSKTLADVMEALVGAAHVDGGIYKAVACLRTLLPNFEWIGVARCRDILYDIAPCEDALPPTMAPVEDLIGYSFGKKALLMEAMTHASYIGTSLRSLERLEFIGDAVLDYIIVTKLFSTTPPLPHWVVHRLKTAMVNGDFQAFLVMETCALQAATNVTKGLQVERSAFEQPLWAFMIHSSPVIGVEQGLGRKRHAELRGDIKAAMEHGTVYPWALLSRLCARKFYSDLLESLLGAVWVDSGSMEACEALLERLGLMRYLRRILRDGVHVTHPKEELGQLAGDSTVRYVIDVLEGDAEDEVFTCRVLVGGELKAEVMDGVDKEEVKTKAAEMAVRVMKGVERGPEEEGRKAGVEVTVGEAEAMDMA